ncbi:MAG: calcium/sodium antiporter [Methanomassiliicoccales archaeon]|nr:calcium/sodium antiporter [Methanomassiliicoccales archaeon]
MNVTDMLLESLMLIAGLVLLYFGGDWLVDGASRLAVSLGVSTFVIGLTIVAMGTSAPEAALAMISSLEGEPSIAFGNIVGSNIANIGLVLGVACFICPLTVKLQLLKREALFLMISIMAIVVLGLDGEISRADALIFLTAAVAFNIYILRSARADRPALEKSVDDIIASYGRRWRHLALLSVGIVLLVAGSQLVLLGAVGIANSLGVNQFIIGLTVVAVGTSIPELAVSVASACRKDNSLLFGTILGSNISNSFLVLGLASVIAPIGVPTEFYLITLPFTLVLYATLIAFMYRKSVLDRRTSLILMVTYAIYIILLIMG